jgi:hypothetical protein
MIATGTSLLHYRIADLLDEAIVREGAAGCEGQR